MASGQASNVQVAVRCRPMSTREEARDCGRIIEINSASVSIAPNGPDARGSEAKTFTYDYAFDTRSTQAEVYETLGQPIVEKALSGYNATIFAYGQTGSGKTHTMMGAGVKGDSAGVIPQLNSHLFADIRQLTVDTNCKFLVTVSFLEIYNEVINDLLNPVKNKTLKVREHPDLGIYVDGLCELVVKSEDDVLSLIEQGSAVRRVASTAMNDTSSRSHSCFTINVEKKMTEEIEGGVTKETSLKSKINLVDLAGSERAKKTGASGSTLKEGASINTSLMALGNVITSLAEGKKHIPYRDSVLTRLLQESLGGNAQTLMMAAISPADYNYDETLGTLRYAHRAKSIENKVSCNEDVNERMLRELKEEIEKLRAQLGSNGGGNNNANDAEVVASAEENKELEEKLESLQKAQESTWEEKERLSKQLEQERSNNMNAVIGEMVDDVKKKKMEMMKAIKRMQQKKEAYGRRLKTKRALGVKLEEKLQADMTDYQKRLTEFEKLADSTDEAGHQAKKEKEEKRLGKLLDGIERSREELLKCRADKDEAKAQIKAVDSKLTEHRAELVAHDGLLDQNKKLRAAIQAEERDKFEQEKALLVQEALGDEKKRLNDQREEMAKTVDEMREEVAQLKLKLKQTEHDLTQKTIEGQELTSDLAQVENRLAEVEVEAEQTAATAAERSTEMEIMALQLKDKDDQVQSLQAQLSQATASILEQAGSEEGLKQENYDMFKGLLSVFEAERQHLEARNQETTALLQAALRDVLFLQQEKVAAQQMLKEATLWEPSLERL